MGQSFMQILLCRYPERHYVQVVGVVWQFLQGYSHLVHMFDSGGAK